MNTETDPIKLELMKHVERAVRPVLAPTGRKMRMRRELIGHLTELYDDELSRLAHPPAAVVRAMERLGEPALLTRELQAGVSRGERLHGRFLAALDQRPNESIRWHNWRVAAVYAMAMGLFLSVIMLLFAAVFWLTGPHEEKPFSLTAVILAMIGTYIVGTFAFIDVARSILAMLRANRGRFLAWPIALSAALFTGPLTYGLAAIWIITITGDATRMVTEFPLLGLLLVVAPALLLGVVIAMDRQHSREAEWTDLAIDG